MHPTGLKIMPASLAFDYVDIDGNSLRELFDRIEGIVIVDAPPGLGKEGLAVINACDDVIVVTNSEFPAVTDAIRVVEVARKLGKNIIGVVVNRFSKTKYEVNLNEIETAIEAPIIAVIPEDKNIKKSIFFKTPVIHHKPYSPSAIEMRKLAANLVGFPYTPPKFAKLKNIFARNKPAMHHHQESFQQNSLTTYEQSPQMQSGLQYSMERNAPGPLLSQPEPSPGYIENEYQGPERIVIKPPFNEFEENSEEGEANIEEAETKKRGPGRPKGSTNKTKKKVGRPKKTETKKRGPGRPKKKK